MKKGLTSLLLRVIFDWICTALVVLPILIYKLHGVPYKRGFFCNDESLSHPYKNGTVSSFALYSIGYGLPIIIILLTEYIISAQWNFQRSLKILLEGRDVNTWLWKCYKVIRVFLFGAACSHLITDIAKYEIGRLRPHFMDACRPNVNCSLAEYQHIYIEDFKCLGSDAYQLREMRLSFMSGHSSSSAFNMIFLAIYVHARWTWRELRLFRHLFQFAVFSLAWFTALSRVSDYKHHWSDVLAGSLQGTTLAVITVLHATELFPRHPEILPTVKIDAEKCTIDEPCTPTTVKSDVPFGRDSVSAASGKSDEID